MRTGIDAFPALSALVSTLFFLETIGPAVKEPRGSGVIVHHGFAVELEDTRDFHTVGTGHAVSTIGARDGA